MLNVLKFAGRCERLPPVRNGMISYNKPELPGGGYPLFTKASLNCNRWFRGESVIGTTCQDIGDGTWAGSGSIGPCVFSNEIK